MFELSGISWAAVFVAALGGMVLGAAWYSPLLFGRAWLVALGKTEDELDSPMPAMIGSAVSCLVSAAAVALLISAAGANTLVEGTAVGMICGLGLVAMSMLSDSLFSGWGWNLYLIQAGYRVLYLILMGAVIGGWPF